MGPEMFELEKPWPSYVGVKHCLTVASGTASLEIALRALGSRPRGRGHHRPVHLDQHRRGGIALVGRARSLWISSRHLQPRHRGCWRPPSPRAPRPSLPVSLFGQMPDYDRINAIAAHHGLPVLEDAAQSFGATSADGAVAGSPSSAAPVSSRPNPWAAMATAGRCSSTTTRWRKRCGPSAPTAA